MEPFQLVLFIYLFSPISVHGMIEPMTGSDSEEFTI